MNHEEKIIEILTQMQQDISELKTGQAVLEGRMTHLEQGQTQLQSLTDSIDRTQKSLEGRLDRLEQGQAEVKQDIEEIKTNIQFIFEDVGRISDRLGIQEKLAGKRFL